MLLKNGIDKNGGFVKDQLNRSGTIFLKNPKQIALGENFRIGSFPMTGNSYGHNLSIVETDNFIFNGGISYNAMIPTLYILNKTTFENKNYTFYTTSTENRYIGVELLPDGNVIAISSLKYMVFDGATGEKILEQSCSLSPMNSKQHFMGISQNKFVWIEQSGSYNRNVVLYENGIRKSQQVTINTQTYNQFGGKSYKVIGNYIYFMYIEDGTIKLGKFLIGSEGISLSQSLTVFSNGTDDRSSFCLFDNDYLYIWSSSFKIGSISKIQISTMSIVKTLDNVGFFYNRSYGAGYVQTENEIWICANEIRDEGNYLFKIIRKSDLTLINSIDMIDGSYAPQQEYFVKRLRNGASNEETWRDLGNSFIATTTNIIDIKNNKSYNSSPIIGYKNLMLFLYMRSSNTNVVTSYIFDSSIFEIMGFKLFDSQVPWGYS